MVFLALVGLALGLAGPVFWEMQTSTLQARWLVPLAEELTWSVEGGPSPSLVFPEQGPYDLRLGYARLPEMIREAGERGFGIAEQARVSPRFRTSVEEWGLFPIYPTKARTGLAVVDRRDESLFARPYPARGYPSFESIPPVVWQSLLFIESRTILDPDRPHMNPAVEWPRLFQSTVDLGLRFLGREGNVAGGSTLATQLEKFRHAPGGLTTSPGQKLAQMASASLRAYRSGQETLPARRRIVLDYLNSVPLAAQPGQGEVTGMGDGLHAWFGRDFSEANRLLAPIPAAVGDGTPPPRAWRGEEDIQAQGTAYREVLSLLLAQRRPSFYLAQPEGAEELRLLTDRYLDVLRDGKVISGELAGAAREAEVTVRAISPPEEKGSFVERKGVDAIRIQLLDALGVADLYALDRLDLTVRTTLDERAQRATTDFLLRMADAEFVRERGFGGDGLLHRGDPAEVVYSVVLRERTERGNLVRIETDNLDTPFSVNESSLLELGSTAKLRTLASYLEVVRALHGRLSGLNPGTLARVEPFPSDSLARWVWSRLLAQPRTELREFLEASMDRRYSASPHERFVTGGGNPQAFSNFDDTYDTLAITVREAFRHSVNLVFVRMMRDVVNHYIYGGSDSKAHVLTEPDSPLRREYLSWFADREGIRFLDRFSPKFRGKSRSEIFEALVRDRRLAPQRVAWVYRTAAPGASWEELEVVLGAARPELELPKATVQDLFRRADPAPHTLADLGYLASVHPLELWVARHLIEHPEASRAEILTSSAGARQDVYRWLFRSRQSTQDRRIRSLLEVEAFTEVHAEWKRLGYPFENIVPSLGSAIGSSGDRPSALGELVGIISNDGIRLPTYRVEELHFAEGTPFETRMTREEAAGERVMAPEVARVLRAAMVDVVENGTGRRMGGVLRRPDGTPLRVGGKTGTGENRHRVFGPGGSVVGSRSMSRTAAFVFFIEDRYHGVVTAYVPGAAADGFRFTSSLTTHLLRELAPALEELTGAPGSRSP